MDFHRPSSKEFLALLLAVLLLQIGVGVVSVAASSAEWPMFRFNLEHTGTTSEAVAPPLSLKWSYTTSGAVLSSPAVSGGIVFIGSYTKTFTH